MKLFCFLGAFLLTIDLSAQRPLNRIEFNLGNLFRLSNARSRSINLENFNGSKGAGGKAGSYDVQHQVLTITLFGVDTTTSYLNRE